MRRTLATVGLAAGLTLIPSVAFAAPDGRISEIESTPGQITYVLSAEGLADGQNIDPASVITTLDSVTVPSTAKPVGQTGTQQTVILAIDTSGSMKEDNRIDTAKDAANQFLAGIPADVQVGVVSFADDAKVVVAPTADRGKVTTAINGLSANGSTALNDAVVLSVDTLGDSGSRSIVMLSDGEDEGSAATAAQAATSLKDSGVVLDAVSIGTGAKELKVFTTVNDGVLVTATDAASLDAAFQSAARGVTTQLAVTVTVPEGTEVGTASLGVSATAGATIISDTSAVAISAAPVATVDGPTAADPDGLLSNSWMPWAIAVLIFTGLLGIVVYAVGAIRPQGRKTGRIARRLAENEPVTVKEKVESTTSLGDSGAIRSVVSFADKVAATRDTTALARKLEVAGLSLRPGEWVVIHSLVAVLSAIVATLLTNFAPLWTLAALVAGAVIPWTILNYRASRRRKAFYEALPDAMQLLSGSLLAGYSLPQALDSMAKESEGVLGEEVGRALLESRLGLPIEEALEAVAQRMESTDFHWVVMAININRRVGGNLAEVLSQVGKTLRERERLRRQVKTLSAEGILSAWILGAIPILLALFMSVQNPDYLATLFTTVSGLIVIACGTLAYVVGIVWLVKTVKIEV